MHDKGGLGLISMQERAAKIGGQLTISSVPGEGTKVREKMGLSLPPDPQKGMERAKGLMQPSNNEDLKRELQELEEEEARLRGGA